MAPGRGLVLGAIGLAAMLSAGVARAQEIYPLGIGYQWKYRSIHGERNTETITGTTVQWGHEVYLRRCSESTYNDSLVQRVSNDPSGGALIWGWTNRGYGVLFDPPILLMKANPVVGEEWGDTTVVHSFPDTANTHVFVYAMHIYTDEILALPVGAVRAFGVGYAGPTLPEQFLGRDICGRLGNGRDGAPGTWYSDQIGMVQESTSDLYQLVEFHSEPIPVENATWGSLKFRWLPDPVSGKSRASGMHRPRSISGPAEPIRLPQ